MDDQKPLSEEQLKARVEELGQELEKARKEVRTASEVTRQHLVGSLIYGGPVTRRWKKCLEWVKHDVQTNQGAVVLREIFDVAAPLHWAFFLHDTRGWLKYDLREMFSTIKRDTEVTSE